jgi:prepilin-type N-terminal cleavage/methylation domain-containing protein
MRGARGFTLTELAVVAAIVALLLGTLMYTLAAQTEQRNFDETRRRLEIARELLLSFAIVNGRLPCPAVCTGPPGCGASETGAEAGGGTAACSTSYGGYLPASTIGFQPVNGKGYALDAWGNPIRYAVSATTWGSAPGRFTRQHVSTDLTSAWSVATSPGDLSVLNAAAGTAIASANTIVAIIFSTGKNGALGCTTCTDEAENTDNDAVFVHHDPRPSTGTGGEFDDQMVWIPVGELYARLIAAGVLP